MAFNVNDLISKYKQALASPVGQTLSSFGKALPTYQMGQKIGNVINDRINLNQSQSYANTINQQAALNIQAKAKTPQLQKNLQQKTGQQLRQVTPMLNPLMEQTKTNYQTAKRSVAPTIVRSALVLSGANKAGLLGSAIGGALGAGINKLTGGNVYEGLGSGMAQGLEFSGLSKYTNPVIAGITGKILGNASPIIQQTFGRGMSGIGSVIENELASRMQGYPQETQDKVLSFALGAILGKGGKTEDWDKLVNSLTLQKQTKEQLRGALGRWTKMAEDKLDTYKVIDPHGKPGEPTVITMREYLKKYGQNGSIDFSAEVNPDVTKGRLGDVTFYHGSDNTQWNPKTTQMRNTSAFGKGVYLSTDAGEAGTWGKNVNSVQIKGKIFTDGRATPDMVKAIESYIGTDRFSKKLANGEDVFGSELRQALVSKAGSQDNANAILKQNGFSAYQHVSARANYEGKAKNLVVFDPNDIEVPKPNLSQPPVIAPSTGGEIAGKKVTLYRGDSQGGANLNGTKFDDYRGTYYAPEKSTATRYTTDFATKQGGEVTKHEVDVSKFIETQSKEFKQMLDKNPYRPADGQIFYDTQKALVTKAGYKGIIRPKTDYAGLSTGKIDEVIDFSSGGEIPKGGVTKGVQTPVSDVPPSTGGEITSKPKYYLGKQMDDLVEIAQKSKSPDEFYETLRPVQRDRLRSLEPIDGKPRPSGNQGVYDFYAQATNTKPIQRLAKPTTPELDTTLEKSVLRKWGETDNPENAAFITSDGRYVSWGGGDKRYADHREIAIGDLQDYMNKTQNIRVHNSPGAPDVNVDITYLPTDDQIPALRKMMEGKKIYSDISAFDGGKKASGEFDSFDEWYSWVKKNMNDKSGSQGGFIDLSAPIEWPWQKKKPVKEPLSLPSERIISQGVGEIPKGGVTKGVQTPLQSRLPETTQPSTKALLNPEVPTTPKPVLQTAQIEGKRIGQNQQSLDSIISEGRKQIKTGGAKEDNRTFRQAVSDLYTQWVDRYNPIVKASQQAKQVLKTKGASLRPEYDPEYLVRRLTGAGGIADQRFQTELKPIIDQVDQLKINKLDLDTYLANKRIAGFGTAGRDIYGADPKKAQEIVSALETKYGENIKGIAQKLYAYQDKGLSEMSDFISPEAMSAMKKQNPDYSPLYRAMDDASDYLGLPTRKTMQGSQPIQKIKGSTRQIESPLESIIGNTFTQRAAIEKNRVAKSIVGLQDVADLGFKKAGKSGNDTITVWKNGKKEYWQVGTEIADVAKGTNEESMNLLLKIIKAPAALLRQGATGRNPEFMFPNVIRDQLDAGITSKYGYIPFVDFVSGLKSMMANDDIYKKWASSGAKIDLGSMSGKKSIKAMFDEKTAKKGLFSWLGKGLDFMGKYSEQPTRVGLFKKAYNKTGNELIAAMESRDATVDFARMGSKMKTANSIIPFLNVGVQGFDKLIRAVKDNPGKVAVLAGVYGAVPQIASTIYNLQNFPEEYAEIPQYEKESNFVLIKGRNERGNVDYITIPKGNVIPVIANPVQSFLEYVHGVDGQSFSKMAMSVVSDALPVLSPGGSLKEVAIKTIGSNLPQAIKPVAETLLNKSFYKYDPNKEQSKDIVPYFLQNRPAYKQAYEFTPKMYQGIGAVLNVSPLQVQNIMEGYLAGGSKIPAQMIDMLSKMSRGEEVETNDKTILRRFIKETYPSSAKPAEPKFQSPSLMERVTGKASAAGPTDKPLDEWQIQDEKYKLKQSDKKYSEVGSTIFYKKSNGDIGQADITKKIEPPKLTGNTELDKKLVSKYKSELTRQASDIVDLYEAGKLDKDTTEKMLQELKGKAIKTGGAKRGKKPSFRIKTVKFPKLKLSKVKKIKVPRPKKQKNYTLKVPKIKKMKITGRLSV